MIITLLTDFGHSDTYVGAMKGIILRRDPRIRIVDLTHEVPPQAIGTASYLLATTFRDFPRGTVHTVVVDPGVGSARAPIACDAGGFRFVGPDNGVLGWTLRECGSAQVRRIENPELFDVRGSSTFHGRDIFAPAAAALAAGFDFGNVGPLHPHWKQGDPPLTVLGDEGVTEVTIVHVDHFGNLILNLSSRDIGDLSAYRLELGGHVVQESRSYFAQGSSREPFLYHGSAGFVEVAVNGGSAAGALGVETGSRGILRHPDGSGRVDSDSSR